MSRWKFEDSLKYSDDQSNVNYVKGLFKGEFTFQTQDTGYCGEDYSGDRHLGGRLVLMEVATILTSTEESQIVKYIRNKLPGLYVLTCERFYKDHRIARFRVQIDKDFKDYLLEQGFFPSVVRARVLSTYGSSV